MKKIMDEKEISRMLRRLCSEVLERSDGAEDIALLGIQTRGVYIAERMKNLIREVEGIDVPIGKLDITLYRDDTALKLGKAIVKETEIPFDINEKRIILVDDVIFTGRTARAALDEIMDFGRPKCIWLLTLLDRGHRELPIEPNFLGKKVPTTSKEWLFVKMREYDDEDGVYIEER
ncbi:MAG: bifunctional pyr operon transcriptional regulator/uracil phosphoribosyltransferase PyrR [Thermotogae bacterium]|nr:bifunctional pyr operon transcriptional regulator/uracil phosphoribosyltransferase PyrR [Thermotogota bacterium]